MSTEISKDSIDKMTAYAAYTLRVLNQAKRDGVHIKVTGGKRSAYSVDVSKV